MRATLRISRYVVVSGCGELPGDVRGGDAPCRRRRRPRRDAVLHRGATLDGIAGATVYAFKVLDWFLIGTLLHIVALGFAARLSAPAGDWPRSVGAPFAPRTRVQSRAVQARDRHRQEVVAGGDARSALMND